MNSLRGEMIMQIARPEYPRPQFVRENWMNLNGTWDFSFETDCFDKSIQVPFAYQTKLSGIDEQDFHDTVWYRRYFDLPVTMQNKTILVHFGAVDYTCEVWVNGVHITEHNGGHIGFTVDITRAVKPNNNEIKLFVQDDTFDMEMPRGKQFWQERSKGIFYTRTTGIWQTVWLEAVESCYLSKVWFTPDVDDLGVEIEYDVCGCYQGKSLQIICSKSGEEIFNHTLKLINNSGKCKYALDKQIISRYGLIKEILWSPQFPNLFDVTFRINDDNGIYDTVKSYFGLRKVSIVDGKFMLNNRPFYQKLLLDQGYWEESLLTAPTDQAFIDDIALSKEMGFNGVRKHQKIEDPRYLYHADTMGFLVWGEIAAAYVYSKRYVKRITDEWIDEIFRDYNHPCIIAWTPINESWGVPNILTEADQQAHTLAMVYLTKSLDKTRPVISNDGWEHTCPDLFTVHDYEASKQKLKEHYSSIENLLEAMPGNRRLFANGFSYAGQPILVTEFGGISYQKGSWSGWGYSNATSDEDFANRYYQVVSGLLESPLVQGFCYTQLTDVEQDVNCLLTYERKTKTDLSIIKTINEGKWKSE